MSRSDDQRVADILDAADELTIVAEVGRNSPDSAWSGSPTSRSDRRCLHQIEFSWSQHTLRRSVVASIRANAPEAGKRIAVEDRALVCPIVVGAHDHADTGKSAANRASLPGGLLVLWGDPQPSPRYRGGVHQPLVLRDNVVVPGLLVVRMGVNTMSDERLSESAEQCHGNWGFWGFSVFEVPDGDYHRLARQRPAFAARSRMLIADGHELVDDGFPLLPTLDAPHWTVVLAAPTAPLFERVRAHFRGPIDNPAYRRTP